MKNWIIAIIVIVLGLVAWYLFSSSRNRGRRGAAAGHGGAGSASATPAVAGARRAERSSSPEPAPEPVVEEPPLPPLADSDPVVVETLTGLVGAEPVAQYVAQEDVVSATGRHGRRAERPAGAGVHQGRRGTGR